MILQAEDPLAEDLPVVSSTFTFPSLYRHFIDTQVPALRKEAEDVKGHSVYKAARQYHLRTF